MKIEKSALCNLYSSETKIPTTIKRHRHIRKEPRPIYFFNEITLGLNNIGRPLPKEKYHKIFLKSMQLFLRFSIFFLRVY